MRISIILGTRPEIIKMAPVVSECEKQGVDFFILHTNQHYSKNLDRIFFKELGLPAAKYNLEVGSTSHGEQTGKMLVEIEKVLKKEKPDFVLVEGDTNSVLAGALAGAKMNMKVGHVEAGLRSYFREMPEEINRILADHCSDFLFAPTQKAEDILLGEGIPEERIFVTGNTIVDSVKKNIGLAEKKSKVLKEMNLKKGGYFLVTAHRAENVDKKEKLKGILKGLSVVFKRFSRPLVYPIHPRAEKRIKEFNLNMPEGINVVPALGYLDFLKLENNAKLILTDSGGVQEEACILKVPCVTLRENTERPETVEAGANVLAGTEPQNILEKTEKMEKKKRDWKNPFGDGKAGKRIIKILNRKLA